MSDLYGEQYLSPMDEEFIDELEKNLSIDQDDEIFHDEQYMNDIDESWDIEE